MSIKELMAQYRKLKAEADALKAEMDAVRAEVEPLVPDEGWQDEAGYARFVTYAPSVGYDNKMVGNLCAAWTVSRDPMIRSCGDMLWQSRKDKPGRKQLQLK